MLTLGSGAITSLSRKQKINGKSSTEAELIAVDESMLQILWTRYFLENQGYSITEDIKKGKTTSSKKQNIYM